MLGNEEKAVVEPTAGAATSPEALRRWPTGTVSRSRLVTIVATIVLLDYITKAMVSAMLPLHESVTIVPGFLDFTHVRNTGAAFGLLNAVDIPFKPVLMTAIALAALIAIAIFAWRTASHEPLAQVALALVFGGATGNLIDRMTAGFVVDFVDVYWRDWHFWAFNVADSAITVGACLLILDMALLNRHVSKTV